MDVTILIRAKNEQELFGRCLEMIFSQDTTFAYEVLLIDSGSTDRTLEIARSFPQVRLHEIPPEQFNYGETLNLGVRMSQGRFVLPLSAHCVPVDNGWLQSLVAPLDGDSTIAASFSRQIAWPDCDPLERHGMETSYGLAGYVQDHADSVRESRMSNSSSCLRRSVALDVPFQALPYGEDRSWAVNVHALGYRIAYVPESAVWHSHWRTIHGYYRMGVQTGKTRAMLGMPDDLPGVASLLRPDRLYSRISKWSRICRGYGHGVLGSRIAGLTCAAKSLARQLGKRHGARSIPAVR